MCPQGQGYFNTNPFLVQCRKGENMYTQFRCQLVEKLSAHFDVFQTNFILDQVDILASGYDFVQKERSLVVYEDGIPMILKTFIACKKVEGMASGSLNNYFLILKNFFVFIKKPLNKITTNDIRVFLYSYQEMKEISNRTLDQYQTYLKTFFGWCADEGYLEKDIARKLKPIRYERKEKKALSQMELEILRNVCETTRDRAIVEFTYSTACRVSEICNVKLSDLNWSDNSVLIFGKGSKYRTSYLNAKAIYYLKEYLKVRKGDSEYLFVGERKPHDKMKKDAIEKRFRELSDMANIGRRITPHLLRHTTATVALQNGMAVTDIQKLLGHEKLDTTMIYAKTNHREVQMNHSKYVV